MLTKRPLMHGFSLLEVVAAITIMAVLAAVVVPRTIGSTDRAGVAETKLLMDSIRLGNAKFRTNTVNQMGGLHMLAETVRPGEVSTCDGTQPGGAVFNYINSDSTTWGGPYWLRPVSVTSGLPVPIGVIDERVKRNFTANGNLNIPGANVSGGAANGVLYITIQSVRLEDAQALNVLYDGGAELSNANQSNILGAIRYSVPDGSLNVVLTYNWPSPTAQC